MLRLVVPLGVWDQFLADRERRIMFSEGAMKL